MNINYKILSTFLALTMFLSWVLFGMYYIINGASTDMIKTQRDDIRRMQNDIITLELRLSEIQSRTRVNQERIESINQARLRDHEFLNSRLNEDRSSIKKIR